MRYRRSQRWLGAVVALALIVTTSAPAFAVDSSIIRSIFFPGAGQAHNGHYTKAALFATAAVISGAGLLATQVHYDRAVDDLDNLKRTYASYPGLLENEVVSQSEIDGTFAAMQVAFDDAEERVKWRNAFLTALIATYTLNLIDVILDKPDTGEIEETTSLSIEMRGQDVMVVKSFSF